MDDGYSGCTITGPGHCVLLGGSVNAATVTNNVITGLTTYCVVVKVEVKQ
jgi:hypothetical protein